MILDSLLLERGILPPLYFQNIALCRRRRRASVSSARNCAQRSTLASRGITGFPYADFPTNQTVRQSLFPFPQYNSNGLAGAPLGNTWYDSLQVNVTQRFSHGLSFNLNYNYSKNLDTMTSRFRCIQPGTQQEPFGVGSAHADTSGWSVRCAAVERLWPWVYFQSLRLADPVGLGPWGLSGVQERDSAVPSGRAMGLRPSTSSWAAVRAEHS